MASKGGLMDVARFCRERWAGTSGEERSPAAEDGPPNAKAGGVTPTESGFRKLTSAHGESFLGLTPMLRHPS